MARTMATEAASYWLVVHRRIGTTMAVGVGVKELGFGPGSGSVLVLDANIVIARGSEIWFYRDDLGWSWVTVTETLS